MNLIIKTAAKITKELRHPNEKSDAKQEGIQHTKATLGEVSKNKWKSKVMRGQYIRNIDRQLISEEAAFLWLLKRDLKEETESEIVAAQVQALQTKYYTTKILNTETDCECRLCQKFDKTIDHIISACPILAKEQYVYIKRHDRVTAQLHFNICKETGIQLDKKTLVRTCIKISRNKPRS
jgi:dGTP triphosphohydrolase